LSGSQVLIISLLRLPSFFSPLMFVPFALLLFFPTNVFVVFLWDNFLVGASIFVRFLFPTTSSLSPSFPSLFLFRPFFSWYHPPFYYYKVPLKLLFFHVDILPLFFPYYPFWELPPPSLPLPVFNRILLFLNIYGLLLSLLFTTPFSRVISPPLFLGQFQLGIMYSPPLSMPPPSYDQ